MRVALNAQISGLGLYQNRDKGEALFDLCPWFRRDGDRLFVTTSRLFIILTLGLTYKRVTLRERASYIDIETRTLWFFKKQRRVLFDWIVEVEYQYDDWNLWKYVARAYDSVDCFSVSLRLKDGSRQRLFRFVGEGTFVNESGYPDWWFEEAYFDQSGNQEAESRYFYNLVQSLIEGHQSNAQRAETEPEYSGGPFSS